VIQFIETKGFTSRIRKLGLERDLRILQDELLANPTRGLVDPGTGGLRKVRMPDSGRGKGKSGGARVHYLHLPKAEVIYLIFVFSKGELDTLSPVQKRQVRALAQAIKHEWRSRP
jgi:hypothetical protein